MKKIFLVAAFALMCSPVHAGDYLNEALLATPVLVQKGNTRLLSYGLVNLSAAAAYIHFYDAAAAADVTVGTTAQVFVLPVGTAGALYFGNNEMVQKSFEKGMVIAATTSPLSTGSTAPSVGIVTQLHY